MGNAKAKQEARLLGLVCNWQPFPQSLQLENPQMAAVPCNTTSLHVWLSVEAAIGLILSPVAGVVTFPTRPQDQVQCLCCLLHVADAGCQQPLTTLPLLQSVEPGLHLESAKDVCFMGFLAV